LKIIGLDRQEYSWIPSNNIVDTSKRSGLHNRAKELLKEKYPNDRILEELVLPGTKTSTRKSTLKADFFIPMRKLIVEVHGEQHYKFVSFYHSNMLNFLKSQKRDREKQEWCELNGIQYIVLGYDESVETWNERINYA
jgi:very-short-patch-repair endonuclease